MRKSKEKSLPDMQKMKYALKTGLVPIYETDENNNIRYIVVDGEQEPVDTGEHEDRYGAVVNFEARIATSRGEKEAREFKVKEPYDVVISTNINEVPINEGTLIWFKKDVEYKNELKGKDTSQIKPESADFKVVAVRRLLKHDMYFCKNI